MDFTLDITRGIDTTRLIEPQANYDVRFFEIGLPQRRGNLTVAGTRSNKALPPLLGKSPDCERCFGNDPEAPRLFEEERRKIVDVEQS